MLASFIFMNISSVPRGTYSAYRNIFVPRGTFTHSILENICSTWNKYYKNTRMPSEIVPRGTIFNIITNYCSTWNVRDHSLLIHYMFHVEHYNTNQAYKICSTWNNIVHTIKIVQN
jgi:hypothetical protein